MHPNPIHALMNTTPLSSKKMLYLIFSILSAIILFIYSLTSFSHELQKAGGGYLKKSLEHLTKFRLSAYALGVVATGIIQSSSAVIAIVIALVDAGTLRLLPGLATILGANLGTTVTAWLVSFKLTGIGPFFIVLGATLSLALRRFSVIGKSIFYFGFIFFTLDLISHSMGPLKAHPMLADYLSGQTNVYLAVVAGAIVTAVIQSSSVTTGLAIILLSQNLLTIPAAIGIVLGANIGTTLTGLIVSIGLSKPAQKAALAGLFFNLTGVILIAFFIKPFIYFMTTEFGHNVVPWSQVFFNLILAVLFLPWLKQIEKLLL